MAQKRRPSSTSEISAAPSKPAAQAVASPPEAKQQMGCMAAIVRLTWLAVGNLALIATALLVLKAGRFSGADVAFWSVLVGLVLVRFVDVSRFSGYTADGQPATMAHWRGYSLKLVAAWSVLWGLAHAAGRAIN
jgi:hypothetical protein